MSSRLYQAVVCVVADLEGFNPRCCDAAQAAQTWAVVDRVLELRGCSQRIGRGMARGYVEKCVPASAIEQTLDALEVEARETVTPAFVARVRALASNVH